MTDSSAQKILCVLYDDPLTGFPLDYARANIPSIDQYPDGQSMPTPDSLGFTPGELLGSVSGGLGLREFLEERGHSFVVTSDKDGPDSVFEAELPDADVVISQPFWPGYLTAERIAKAPNLKMAITAGIGSDHVDLQAAINSNVTVCEVTWCNSISVAEHAVMQMLALVRDYIPQYGWVVRRGLEHRRRHLQVLRHRGHGRWSRSGRKNRPGGPQKNEAVRREAPLQRPAQAGAGSGGGARLNFPRKPSSPSSAPVTWSASTARSTPRRSTCLTMSL